MLGPPQPPGGLRAHLARRAGLGAAAPRLAGIGAQGGGELGYLLLGEQRRVVLRMALDRQPVALDRVGHDHRGPVIGDGPERGVQRAEVVPAQVADGPGQGRVVEVGDERRDRLVAARAAWLRSSSGAAPQQPLVLGVGHLVDPLPQRLPARPGEQLLQQVAVLQGDHLPARRGEHARAAGRPRSPARRGPATAGSCRPPRRSRPARRRRDRRSPPTPRPRPARRRPAASTGGRCPPRRCRCSRYRRATAPQTGAVAPMPTDPVE